MAEKQIRIIFGTTTSYQQAVVSNKTKIKDFVRENNLSSTGATLQLNGSALGADKLDKTFEDMIGNLDEITLMSVVNAKNA